MFVLDAAVSLMTGCGPGLPPTGYTKTSKAGPDAGTGVQAYDQPIFHGALATVNGGLVHVPVVTGVGPTRSVTVPVGPGAVVAGTDVGDVVPGVADVVDVALPVVVDVATEPPDPAGGGRVYVGAFDCVDDAVPILEFPMIMPTTSVAAMATTRCQVRHDRRSLILSAPAAGAVDSAASEAGRDAAPFPD